MSDSTDIRSVILPRALSPSSSLDDEVARTPIIEKSNMDDTILPTSFDMASADPLPKVSEGMALNTDEFLRPNLYRALSKIMLGCVIFLLKIGNIVALFVLLDQGALSTTMFMSNIYDVITYIALGISMLLLLEVIMELLYQAGVSSDTLKCNHELNVRCIINAWGCLRRKNKLSRFMITLSEYSQKTMFRMTFTAVEIMFAISGCLVISYFWRMKGSNASCTYVPGEMPLTLGESIYAWSWTDRHVPIGLYVADTMILTLNTLHPIHAFADTSAEKGTILDLIGNSFFWASRFNQPIILLPLSSLVKNSLCMDNPHLVFVPLRILIASLMVHKGSWSSAFARGNKNVELIILYAIRVFMLFLTFASVLMLIEFNPLFAATNESIMGESFIANGVKVGKMHLGVGYYLYFTIIVATTVGLGDIHPVTVVGQAMTGIFVIVVFANVPRFIDAYTQARRTSRVSGYLPWAYSRRRSLYVVGPIRLSVAKMVVDFVKNINTADVKNKYTIIGIVFVSPPKDYDILREELGATKHLNFNVTLVKGDLTLGGDNAELAKFLGSPLDCRSILLIDNLRATSSLNPLDRTDNTPMEDSIFRMKALQYFLSVKAKNMWCSLMSSEGVGLLQLQCNGRVHDLSELKSALLALSLMGNWGLATFLLPMMDFSCIHRCQSFSGSSCDHNETVSIRYVELPELVHGETLKDATRMLYAATSVALIGLWSISKSTHYLFGSPNNNAIVVTEGYLGIIIGTPHEFQDLMDRKFEMKDIMVNSLANVTVDKSVSPELLSRSDNPVQKRVHKRFTFTRTLSLRASMEQDQQLSMNDNAATMIPNPEHRTIADTARFINPPSARLSSHRIVHDFNHAKEVWKNPHWSFIVIVGMDSMTIKMLDYLVESQRNLLILTCGKEIPYHPRTLERYSGAICFMADSFRPGPSIVNSMGLSEASSILVNANLDSQSLFYYNIIYLYTTGGNDLVQSKNNRTLLVLKDFESLDYFQDREQWAHYNRSNEFQSGRVFVDNTLHPLVLHDNSVASILGPASNIILRPLLGLDPIRDGYDAVRIQRRLNPHRVYLKRVNELIDPLEVDDDESDQHPLVKTVLSIPFGYLFINALEKDMLVIGLFVTDWCELTKCMSHKVVNKPDNDYKVRTDDYAYVICY